MPTATASGLDELRPCPFCAFTREKHMSLVDTFGRTGIAAYKYYGPRILHEGVLTEAYAIECQSCGAIVFFMADDRTKEEVIRRWNERPSTEQ